MKLEHGLSGYTLENLLALRERLTPNEWQRIANYYHEPEEGAYNHQGTV